MKYCLLVNYRHDDKTYSNLVVLELLDDERNTREVLDDYGKKYGFDPKRLTGSVLHMVSYADRMKGEGYGV